MSDQSPESVPISFDTVFGLRMSGHAFREIIKAIEEQNGNTAARCMMEVGLQWHDKYSEVFKEGDNP